MEFITSKGVALPKDQEGIETEEWFNIWEKRNFPYKELLEGDILYWFDTIQQQLVWKTRVVQVERFPYGDKNELYKKYHNSMTLDYFKSRPEKGYFLHYRVQVIEKLNIPKPKYSFSQLGWERMDEENYKRWFGQDKLIDYTTLDNASTSNKSLKGKLEELDKKMQYVSPERITKLVTTTLRNDSAIINAIKKAAGYKCQFRNCGHQIKKKDGSYYIEVAHIEPVKNLGQSILGNLLVLCPNHHKEFDYGDRVVKEQTVNKISGLLNGKAFSIETNNND